MMDDLNVVGGESVADRLYVSGSDTPPTPVGAGPDVVGGESPDVVGGESVADLHSLSGSDTPPTEVGAGPDVVGGESVADLHSLSGSDTPPTEVGAPFRLGISGSSFIYAMPKELVQTSIIAAQRATASKFDDRQNAMMVEFMREMMDAVNSSSISSMECYHSMSWSKEAVLQVVLDNPRVELWSVHAPYGKWFNPSSPEEKSRQGALTACLDAVDVADRIGAGIVVVHPGADVAYDEPREVRLRHTVEVLKEVADAAGERGVRLGVEPMPVSEIGNSMDEILAIIDGIGRPNVGINFDTNHQFPASAIPDLIRRAGSLILSIHISDQDDRERHWLPFEGKIDWPAVLSALSEIGYTGPLIYEAHIHDAQSCEDVVRKVEWNYGRMMGAANSGTANGTR